MKTANFGQHYRYPYIPRTQFWIDREAQHDEREFFTRSGSLPPSPR